MLPHLCSSEGSERLPAGSPVLPVHSDTSSHPVRQEWRGSPGCLLECCLLFPGETTRQSLKYYETHSSTQGTLPQFPKTSKEPVRGWWLRKAPISGQCGAAARCLTGLSTFSANLISLWSFCSLSSTEGSGQERCWLEQGGPASLTTTGPHWSRATQHHC